MNRPVPLRAARSEFRLRPLSSKAAKAALLVIVAEVMFTSMGATIKAMSAELPSALLVFFRNAFALLLVAPLALQQGWAGLSTPVGHLHVLRGVAGLGAMYCFFYALANIKLAEAATLAMTAPLFIPFIAWLWLREPLSARLKWAALIGFVGVVLVLKPGLTTVSAAALIGVLGGMLAAFAKVVIRRMGSAEPSTRVVFYFSAIATVGSAIPAAILWQMPSPRMWLMFVLLGGFAAVGQLLLTKAFAMAPSARVAPLTYVAVIFAALYGWLFWREPLGLLTMLGAACIVAAGITAVHRGDKPGPHGPEQVAG